MVYTSGAKILADLIDEIANGLIGSQGGFWTDADTTWNISNKTENNARRALKYTNTGEVLYIAFEAINQTNGLLFYSTYYGKGLRIVVSATWDSINHIYPSSNQSTFVPFQVNTAGYAVTADLASLQVTYYLWIESNGFVITGKPEPHADTTQQSFFVCIERNTNKEYTDGFTNFYVIALLNLWTYGVYDGTYASLSRYRSILRPFAYQYPDITTAITSTPQGNGISFVPLPTYFAFKSLGNGKVYYVKPIIHNTANQLSPIFQSELWFPWSEGVGLVDGDIVAIDGQTTKFLCKALDSPDSVNRLPFAIKYVA